MGLTPADRVVTHPWEDPTALVLAQDGRQTNTGLTPVARVATHRSATQVPARGLAHLDPTSGVTLLSALKDQVLVQPSSVPTPAARANENLSISETA